MNFETRSTGTASFQSLVQSEYPVLAKMSRILLVTDSNYINNVGTYKGQMVKNLEVKSCQSRKAAIQAMSEVEEGIVVISCLDMMAADVYKSTLNNADAAVEVYLNQLVFKIVDRVDETDGKVAFGIVAPLFWSSHPQPVSRALNHTFKLLKNSSLNNIWFSEYVKEVKAGADGVHLTRTSADRYIKHIVEFFSQISEASSIKCIELENNPALGDQPVPGAQGGSDWAADETPMQVEEAGSALLPPADVPSPTRTTSMLSASILEPVTRHDSALQQSMTQSRLLRLADYPDLSIPPPAVSVTRNLSHFGSLASLERRVDYIETKSFYNDLMTAGLKEELDTEANKAMLNRVTVSGVDLPDLHKMTDTEKVKAMKEKIAEIFEKLKDEGQEFEVTFVRHLNRKIRGAKFAVIEVKLSDQNQAKILRSNFVKKRKELPDKLNISPVVRLVTRVRIEILHSVADLRKKYDRTISSAYCLQFIPKPAIKIVRKSVAGTESTRTMSFCDAVSWVQENNLRNVIDLRKARDRAGATFRSALSQHFVLMD